MGQMTIHKRNRTAWCCVDPLKSGQTRVYRIVPNRVIGQQIQLP